ncbi:MAG: hypothetical protein H7829_03460 [Magnetococcus sp. THC-1_WYH]
MSKKKNEHHNTDHKIMAIMNVQIAQTMLLHRTGVLPVGLLMEQLAQIRIVMEQQGNSCAIPAFDDLCETLAHIPGA